MLDYFCNHIESNTLQKHTAKQQRILYFSPFSIFRPELLPPRKMQFRDCYFCHNSLIMIINRKDYFFRNKRHSHLVNALEIFFVFFCFSWSKYATFRVSESKKAARFLLPPSVSRNHRSGKPKSLRCSEFFWIKEKRFSEFHFTAKWGVGVAFFMRYLYQHNSSKNNPAADQIHQGIVFILQ